MEAAPSRKPAPGRRVVVVMFVVVGVFVAGALWFIVAEK